VVWGSADFGALNVTVLLLLLHLQNVSTASDMQSEVKTGSSKKIVSNKVSKYMTYTAPRSLKNQGTWTKIF